MKSILVSNIIELVNAVNNASPGDTVILKDGIYQNAEFTFSGRGNASAYITIRPENPGGVQFTEDSQLVFEDASYIEFCGFYFNNNIRLNNGKDNEANANIFITGGCHHINIRNNKFYKSGNNDYAFGPIILVSASDYINIEDNSFDNSMGVSVMIRNASKYNTIRRNHFKNIDSTQNAFGATNGMECLLIGSRHDRLVDFFTTVENNFFENVTGEGSEIISNKSSSNIYRYNIFRDCPSMLTLRFGNNCRVEGNFFYNMKGGIRIYGSGHKIINNYIDSVESGDYFASIKLGHEDDKIFYQAAKDVEVINNIIVNPKGEGIKIGKEGTDIHPENILIKNNFISADNGTAIQYYGGTVKYENNILYLSGTAKAGVVDAGVIQVSVNSDLPMAKDIGCNF